MLIIELIDRRYDVIQQMRELEASTEAITTAFEDPEFQKEAANARFVLDKILD